MLPRAALHSLSLRWLYIAAERSERTAVCVCPNRYFANYIWVRCQSGGERDASAF